MSAPTRTGAAVFAMPKMRWGEAWGCFGFTRASQAVFPPGMSEVVGEEGRVGFTGLSSGVVRFELGLLCFWALDLGALGLP